MCHLRLMLILTFLQHSWVTHKKFHLIQAKPRGTTFSKSISQVVLKINLSYLGTISEDRRGLHWWLSKMPTLVAIKTMVCPRNSRRISKLVILILTLFQQKRKVALIMLARSTRMRKLSRLCTWIRKTCKKISNSGSTSLVIEKIVNLLRTKNLGKSMVWNS